jgi:hypothetical protein
VPSIAIGVASIELLMLVVDAVFVLRQRAEPSAVLRYQILPSVVLVSMSMTMAVVQVPFAEVGLVGLGGYVMTVVGRLLRAAPPRLQQLRYRVARLIMTQVGRRMSALTIWVTVAVSIWLVSASLQTLLMLIAGLAALYVVRWPYDNITYGTWMWSGALILTALLLAIAERTVTWITDVRPDIVAQLIAVQLVVAVIPLTIAAAAAQLAVASLGIRAAMAVPLRRITAAFLASIVSIGVDLWQFGRPPGRRISELAEVMALLVVIAVVLSIVHLLPSLEPESVNERLVRRLNRDWLERVVYGYGPNVAARPIPRDRFNAVERIVHLASTREGESQVLFDVLAQLSRRLEEVGSFGRRTENGLDVTGPPPDVECALDLYFAGRFQPLIDEVASEKREWVLEYLLQFRGWLERSAERRVPMGPQPATVVTASSPTVMRRVFGSYPGGLNLYSVVIRATIGNSLAGIAADGITRAGRYAQRAMRSLPDSQGVSLFHPPGPNAQYSVADEQYWGLESYFTLLREWSREAADRGLREVPSRVAAQLTVLYDVAAEQDDREWMRWLIQTIASTSNQVALDAAERDILALMLPVRLRPLRASDPAESEVATRVGGSLPGLLMAIERVYTWLTLGMSAMNFAQDLLPDFPTQAGAIAAVVVHLEGARVRNEVEQRIMQPIEVILDQVRRRAAGARQQFDHAYAAKMQEISPPTSLLRRLTRRARA